jgi:hypothetical protein
MGRSGSTVLDTVLGNHPQAVSVGELNHAPRAFSSTNEYCACGRLARDCPFWNRVDEEWRRLSGFSLASPDFQRLQARFERTRRLGFLVLQAFVAGKAFRRYALGLTTLYVALKNVSGKSVVVDSSKSPSRALALSRMEAVDLRLIHLVRDGRGVIWSLLKPYSPDPERGVQRALRPKPVWRTALVWNLVNRLTAMVARRLPADKTSRLRYEDFVETPRKALSAIGAIAGLDYSEQASALEEGREFAVDHTIAGNRVRMGGVVRLQANHAWRDRLGGGQRRLFWLLAGGLAKRLGYRREG